MADKLLPQLPQNFSPTTGALLYIVDNGGQSYAVTSNSVAQSIISSFGLINQASFNLLSGNLGVTGQTLFIQINSTSGALNNTGSYLYNLILTTSGAINSSGQVASFSGFVANTYYPITNPSGFISTAVLPLSSVVYTTGIQNIGSFKQFNVIIPANISGTGLFIDSNNVKSITWDGRQMFDSSPSLSVDWGNRQLIDDNGQISADWDNHFLSYNGVNGVDWKNNLLTANAQTVFDWQNDLLYDKNIFYNGLLSIDIGNRKLYSNPSTNVTTVSIDWQNLILSGNWTSTSLISTGIFNYTGVVFTTGNQNITGNKTFYAITPKIISGQGMMVDGAGFNSVQWNNRFLTNNNGTNTVDWQNTLLNDASNVLSLNWSNRQLFDNTGSLSIDYNQRMLVGGWTVAVTGISGYLATGNIIAGTGINVVQSGNSIIINYNGPILRYGSGNPNGFTTGNLGDGYNDWFNKQYWIKASGINSATGWF